MAFKACGLVKEVTTTSGSSPTSIALGGSMSGWNAFGGLLSNGDTTVVTIHASDGGKATLLVTYVSATNSLTVDSVISSTNGGSMIDLPSGSHTVFGDVGADGVEKAYSAIQSDPSGITGADTITNIVSLTQAEYDAIGSPSASTLYIITDA